MIRVLVICFTCLIGALGASRSFAMRGGSFWYSNLNSDFTDNYYIGDHTKFKITQKPGVIKESLKRIGASESNDGNTVTGPGWGVSSKPCRQNKTLTCFSTLKTQINRDNEWEKSFEMHRINQEAPANNSIVKCKGGTTQNTFSKDSFDIQNCTQLSKKSCEEWDQYLAKNPLATFSNQEVKKCSDMLQAIARMKAIFALEENDKKMVLDEIGTVSDGSLKANFTGAGNKKENLAALFNRTQECNDIQGFFTTKEEDKAHLDKYKRDLKAITSSSPATPTPAPAVVPARR